MIDLTNPIFADATKAREYLESVRWADGAYCPHCGEYENIRALKGKSHRPGLYQCNGCRHQFTVTVGTVFERSKIPLNKWMAAFFLMTASKKGISAHQIHRMLGITYKSAWFMCHRIREAMRDDSGGPLGGTGKVIEVDESFVGGKAKNRAFVKEPPKKQVVLSLVERDGRVRSHHVPDVTSKTLRPAIVRTADRKSFLMTDEALQYKTIGKEFAAHAKVDHKAKEYVRFGIFHTNTVEGYFSILKRGINGVYQAVSEQHLQRYLAEFDFRYSNRAKMGVDDTERANLALMGSTGKRLTYRRTDEATHA